jgi:hypothetical protein
VTNLLAQVVVWLNTAANAIGQWALAPIAVLPGWLSATLVAAVTGVILLVAFKYTSNQRAIKRARDQINASLLALKLFKDSASVAVQAQGRIFVGAGRLIVLALVPMLVMAIPVTLVLGQLSLWYQQRPLPIEKEIEKGAVVTMALNGDKDAPIPEVHLKPSDAFEIVAGPAHVTEKREIWWRIRARETGIHQLEFHVGDQVIDKELAVGDGFMRVSVQRPEWDWFDALMHPWEKPLGPDSTVRSIEIAYPDRSPSFFFGISWWLVYWFGMSMVVGFCFRGLLKVNI